VIDISSKFETLREAKAEARVKMAESTMEAVRKGRVPKGNVLEMARAAAIMAFRKKQRS
jgi:molybdenum cofactor biosynthesis enzyme